MSGGGMNKRGPEPEWTQSQDVGQTRLSPMAERRKNQAAGGGWAPAYSPSMYSPSYSPSMGADIGGLISPNPGDPLDAFGNSYSEPAYSYAHGGPIQSFVNKAKHLAGRDRLPRKVQEFNPFDVETRTTNMPYANHPYANPNEGPIVQPGATLRARQGVYNRPEPLQYEPQGIPYASLEEEFKAHQKIPGGSVVPGSTADLWLKRNG